MDKLTVKQLQHEAKKLNISGIYKYRKKELIQIITNINQNQNNPSNNNLSGTDENEIQLNQQQQQIINEDLNKNIRIIACAGSGKTTTIIYRFKHLIDNGIESKKIMITTFNVDACKSIKNKVNDVMGYIPNSIIGTIDSISKRFYYKYFKVEKKYLGISEYSTYFLNFLRSKNGHLILNQFEYIFFDEFQDINQIQFDILTCFYNSGCKVIVIGDDAQNIYPWRGSNIDFILNINKYFDNVATHKLVYNYRSTPEIINFANDSISKNTDQIPKKMLSVHKSCQFYPTIQNYENWYRQHKDIIKKIVYFHNVCNVPLGDIAIISRNNLPLKYIEEALEKYNSEHTPKLKYMALITDNQTDIKPKIVKDHITLTTIHKSKGLEWDVVFMIGCNDEFFPSEINKIGIQEERRLFYVAITRAKRYLFISFIGKHVSRFIKEINSKFYNFIDFKNEYFNHSQFRNIKYENSVTEIIKMLNQTDYKNLRDQEILPNFTIEEEILHSPHPYHSEINQYFLHSDFGTFIDRYISRCIGEKNPKSLGLYDDIAEVVINAVVLNNKEFKSYQKYKNNFVININKITSVTNTKNYCSILSTNTKKKGYIYSILNYDKSNIISIVKKMIETSRKNKIKLSKLILIPESYIPERFRNEMVKSLINYKLEQQPCYKIMKDIYNVSLCGNIYQKRRRLLYKNVFEVFNHSQDLFKDIESNFIERIREDKLRCKYIINNQRYDIIGEMDLINVSQKSIIDFKCSKSNEVNLEWILQLLTYNALLSIKKNASLKTIQIYNPIAGKLYTIDISEWKKSSELLRYLYKKREDSLTRNKTSEKVSNYMFLD